MTLAEVNEDVVISRPGYLLPRRCLPASDGAAPCVVFFAGSGPTDRDWTSPLLPGGNGSGAQLARELQARGVGSIRFDKVGSGVNMPKSSAPADLAMLDVLSLAHYVDEAVTAFDELASGRVRRDLPPRPQRRIAPRSSAAIAKQADPRFGGLISLSGPSRSLLDTAIEQIRAMRMKAASDAATVDRALSHSAQRAEAGGTGARPVRAPRGRGTVAGDHDPLQQRVAREFILAEPLAPLSIGCALVVGRQRRPVGSHADRDLRGPVERSRGGEGAGIADANHVYNGRCGRRPWIPRAERIA